MDVEININPSDIRYAETKCVEDVHSNVEVATSINVDKYWDIIEEALKKYE